ncbi:hypothetical protein RI129_007700 [Pyrocoelia pectoralis]|uniref:CCHC-type domain-containing protein n=1 Tax=Pyrocoelia pectoralis TaxID=417401 RepID=A0AAN7V8G5_9COLE
MVKLNNLLGMCKLVQQIGENYIRHMSFIYPAKLEITGLKNISNGGIAIECKSKECLEKVVRETESKLGSDYEVKVPKNRAPKLKIVGITEQLTNSQIEQKIRSQNKEIILDQALINVVYVSKEHKNHRNYFCLVEVDGKTYEMALRTEKLNIGWDRCRVYDAVNVRRCYKCSGYGHKSQECRNTLACPRCAEAHELKECKTEQKDVKCINCKWAVENLKINLDIGHEAWSKDCRVFKRKLEAERSKIDFLYCEK